MSKVAEDGNESRNQEILSQIGSKIKGMMVDVNKKKPLSRKGSLVRGSSFRVHEKVQNNI